MLRLARSRASLLFAFILLLTVTLSPASASTEVTWGDDITAALKQAQRENKPVLVDIWAVWCVPCAEMDKTTYRDPKVLEAVEDFVTVKVDADVQKIFIERYRIDAYPTVLVLDGKGNEITRRMGLVSTSDLLDMLDRTNAGYRDYLAATADRKNPDSQLALARFFASSGNAEEACACYNTALKKMKKVDSAVRNEIELEMARTMVDADHIRSAVKSLRKLSKSGATAEIREQALGLWVEAERARGRDDDADEVQSRLEAEFPSP